MSWRHKPKHYGNYITATEIQERETAFWANVARKKVTEPDPLEPIIDRMLKLINEQLRPGDDLTKAGVKFDDGKTRFDLLPPEGVRGVADILTIGAKKYAARNWEQGMDWSRPYGAALRHLFAWWGGEDKDPDTGKSHLWHAACNLFFLIAYEARGTGNDDRPRGDLTASGV